MNRSAIFFIVIILLSCSDDGKETPGNNIFHFAYGLPDYLDKKISLASAGSKTIMATNQMLKQENFPDYHIAMTAVDELGNVAWANQIRATGEASLELIDFNNIQNRYMMLAELSPGANVVAEFDENGKVLKAKKYINSKGISINHITETTAGELVLSGKLYNDGNESTIVIKENLAGEIAWAREVPGDTYEAKVAVSGDYIYVVAATSLRSKSVYQFDLQGELLRSIAITSETDTDIQEVVAFNNDIVIAFYDSFLGNTYLIKLSSQLEINRTVTLAASCSDLVYSGTHLFMSAGQSHAYTIFKIDLSIANVTNVEHRTVAYLGNSHPGTNGSIALAGDYVSYAVGLTYGDPNFGGRGSNLFHIKTDDLLSKCDIPFDNPSSPMEQNFEVTPIEKTASSFTQDVANILLSTSPINVTGIAVSKCD